MTEKKTDRQKREDRLAQNLRDNLRRRKAAARKTVGQTPSKDKDDTAPESP